MDQVVRKEIKIINKYYNKYWTSLDILCILKKKNEKKKKRF